MCFGHVHSNVDNVANTATVFATVVFDNNGSFGVAKTVNIKVEVTVDKCFVTQFFEVGNFDLHDVFGLCNDFSIGGDVFTTETNDDLFVACEILWANLEHLIEWNCENVIKTIKTNFYNVALAEKCCIEEVHLRCADKARNKLVLWVVVQVLWGVDLLNVAHAHNNDTSTHCHGLYLVVSNVDKRCADFVVKFCNFRTHFGTKFCVQVRKWFVQKEYFWCTQNCTTQRYTLTLTTGQCLWFTFEVLFEFQNFSRPQNFFVNFCLWNVTEIETESQVFVNGHVWIQSVVLENHCDIAVFGLHVVGKLVANVQFACGDFFKAGNHTQCC